MQEAGDGIGASERVGAACAFFEFGGAVRVSGLLWFALLREPESADLPRWGHLGGTLSTGGTWVGVNGRDFGRFAVL